MVLDLAAPKWLVLSVLGALVLKGVVICFGRRLPRRGDWLVGFSLLAILVVLFWDLKKYFQDDGNAQSWSLGWILPPWDNGALRLGVYLDGLGLVISILASLIALILVFNCQNFFTGKYPQRACASIGVGAMGVVLSWISLTPWFSFLGITVTFLGGIIALATDWDSESGASLAARFVFDRLCSLILALVGAYILAGSGAVLEWGSSHLLAVDHSHWVGSFLLVSGIFLLLLPFPLLGWGILPSALPLSLRIVVLQIFPAWAGFSLLVRLEEPLRAIGLLPNYGWIGLITAFLTMLTGLFQADWKLGAGFWVSSTLIMAACALSFSGLHAGVPLMISSGLGGTVIPLVGLVIVSSSKRNRSNFWAKALCFLCALSSSGMFGFLSGSGSIQWLAPYGLKVDLILPFVFLLFFWGLLAWKILLTLIPQRGFSVRWGLPLFSVGILIVLNLGVVWIGSVLGGVYFGFSDQIISSLLERLFQTSIGPPDSSGLRIATFIQGGVLLAVVVTTYWIFLGEENFWQRLDRAFPKVVAFIRRGYALDLIFSQLKLILARLGTWIEYFIEHRMTSQWMPSLIAKSVERVSRATFRADQAFSRDLVGVIRLSVNAPAKFLQIIQNGNVQWYLFFAIGSGIAMLIHFLKP